MKKLLPLISVALLTNVAFAADMTATKTTTTATTQMTTSATKAVSDATLTSNIKAALKKNGINIEKDAKGTGVMVDTKEGMVTLSGKLATQEMADKAVSTAKGVEGVKDVKSTITVQ